MSISRRSFIKGGIATIAAIGAGGALTACGSSANTANTNTAAKAAIEIKSDMEELNVVTNLKDTKISSIAVALEKGYYTEENLTVNQQPFGGGFPEIMPALSKGSVDVVPFGSIPSCTYISQGDDLVIFGGTVLDGSECVTLAENKDKYKKAEDFKGTKIGCFRMETGHMAMKSWLRKQGLKIGKSADELTAGTADVAFILLEGSAAEVEAVKKGELDMCFVNSGYGYTATQDSAVAVAFRPNELIGHDFPCCRQTTNRSAFENKKSALVKFEIANLRGLCDINTDKSGTIKTICANSGQPEAYVEATMYSLNGYTAAMKFEMDPMTDDVKTFYEDMVDNGDFENTDKDVILDHMDSTIYMTALQTLIDRGDNKDFYEGLMKTYKEHNTLGK